MIGSQNRQHRAGQYLHSIKLLHTSVLLLIIIIIIITRPGANTTKYNHQRDNLLMGHVVRSIVLL